MRKPARSWMYMPAGDAKAQEIWLQMVTALQSKASRYPVLTA